MKSPRPNAQRKDVIPRSMLGGRRCTAAIVTLGVGADSVWVVGDPAGAVFAVGAGWGAALPWAPPPRPSARAPPRRRARPKSQRDERAEDPTASPSSGSSLLS